MKKMKISVLMPIYEKEKEEYFEQAMKSIVNQTLKPDEVVIIEDGKITTSLECVIEKYKKEFPNLIKIIKVKEKSTLGKALAIGINNCKNEYVARMDADDICINTRFEEQAKILSKHPEIDILGGFIAEYDEKMEKQIGIRKVPIGIENIKKFTKWQCPFNHSTVILKKSTILKIGNYKDISIEDYELWARMLVNKCNMENCDKILVKYRTSKDMYKRRSGKKRIKDITKIEKILLSYGIINKVEFIINICLRVIYVILPVKIKEMIYKIIHKL